MLVSNNVFKNRYIYDGSQTYFPISFPFLDNGHIQVWYSYPGQPDTDAKILHPSNYTVTGAGNPAGGVLTRLVNWTPGVTLAIVRNVPVTQLHQYTQYDNFPAESHEDALAKLTMICQQLDEICSRAMTVPVTSEKNPQEYWQDILEQNQIALDASLRAVAAAAQAETCKTQACQCAQSALDTEGRINAAVSGQITAINSAGEAQIDAIYATTADKLVELSNEGNNQIGRVTSQGQTEVDKINTIGDSRYNEISTLGTQYVNTINADGSKWVSDINTAGKTNIAAVNTTGTEAITRVTETGNYQESRIIGVGSNTVQEVRQEAQVAKIEADRAKSEADRAEAEADRAQQVAFGDLPIANHVVKGITRLATTQEHLDATDDTIAATPLGVKQVAQQFVNIVITQPAITGPDSVREQSTHAYSLQAKALLPDAKIVAFYYHIDELGPTPIKVDVPTASQAIDVTIDTNVTFPGNIGVVNTLIVYAEDSYGNLSRYSSKPVEIRLNEPPNMSEFTHTIPATVASGATYTIKMSGATDPDGDPVTYKFDFGTTGIIATPNTGITDNQNIQLILPKDNTKYPPSSTNKTYILSFKIIAIDSLGATNQVTITTTMSVTFDAPAIGSPRQGQADFSPLGPITWGTATIVNSVATPNKTHLQVARDIQFTMLVKDVSLDEEITSVDFQLIHALPYNEILHCRSKYELTDKVDGLWADPVSFTTKVTLPKPTFTVEVGDTIVQSGSTASKTDAETDNITITVAATNAIPTGEMATNVEYQIANNLSFTNAYTARGEAHIVNDIYRLALEGGMISSAVPAVPTYMRVRQTAVQVGAAGYEVDVTSEWSNVYILNLVSASLTAPVLVSPINGATDIFDTQVTLTWNNGIAIGQTVDQVQIQVATDAAFSSIVKESGAINLVTNWSITDLNVNKVYYWRVRNKGSATGWSAWSTTFNFKTIIDKITSMPVLTAPNNNWAEVPRSVGLTVSWEGVSVLTGAGTLQYHINVYKSDFTTVIYHKDGLPAATRDFIIPQFTWSNATVPNEYYYVQVVASFSNILLEGGDAAGQWKEGHSFIRTSPPALVQSFYSNQTYTIPYSGTYSIQAVGGGGGTGITGMGGGGGGGAGGYIRVNSLWLNQGTVLTVQIGAGGGVGSPGGNTFVTIDGKSIIAGGGVNGQAEGAYGVGGAGGTGGGYSNSIGGINALFYIGGSGGVGDTYDVNLCGKTIVGSRGQCSGNACNAGCKSGVDHILNCTNVMGSLVPIIRPGCGGAICTVLGATYGGGGGSARGNDLIANITGQPGVAYIENQWTV